MKPKEFLEWYRYNKYGGKRNYKNYLLIKSDNKQAYNKLMLNGKFRKDPEEYGVVLEFPSKNKDN